MQNRRSADMRPAVPSGLARSLLVMCLLAPGSLHSQQVTRAAPVLRALDAYTGQWRSDTKTTAAGDTIHFEYDLQWFDPDRTTVRMRIFTVAASGRTSAWEGFKGQAPGTDMVYYVAASPAGRGARGTVWLDGSTLVTRYDGWAPDGNRVEVRDVFEPVSDDRFTSITYLRPAGQEEWRELARDYWTRTDQGSDQRAEERPPEEPTM